MDIASLIGLLGAIGMIAGAMISAGGIGPYHTASSLIVIGGTFFAVMYETLHFLGSFGDKAFLPSVKKQDVMIERG